MIFNRNTCAWKMRKMLTDKFGTWESSADVRQLKLLSVDLIILLIATVVFSIVELRTLLSITTVSLTATSRHLAGLKIKIYYCEH